MATREADIRARDVRVDLRYAWNNLDEQERRDALESTDVLTVQPVRHPVTRAFSA